MELAEVRKVASLARLAISESELAEYGERLSCILDYVRLLDEVDIDGIEPMPHAVDLSNVFREDLHTMSLPTTAALANAPKTDGQYFQVPQILEEKSGQ